MPASADSARSKSPKRTTERSVSNAKEKASSDTRDKEKRDRSSLTDSTVKDIKVKDEKTEKEWPAPAKPSNRHKKSYSYSNSGKKERKFTGRCRLFIGNLVNTTEDDLREMFKNFGEMSEVFVNQEKGFGFIRLVRN